MAGFLATTIASLSDQLLDAKLEAGQASWVKRKAVGLSGDLQTNGASESVRLMAELLAASARLGAQPLDLEKLQFLGDETASNRSSTVDQVKTLRVELRDVGAKEAAAKEAVRVVKRLPKSLDAKAMKMIGIAMTRDSRNLKNTWVDWKSRDSITKDQVEVAESMSHTEASAYDKIFSKLPPAEAEESAVASQADAAERERMRLFSESVQLRSAVTSTHARLASASAQTQVFLWGAKLRDVQDQENSDAGFQDDAVGTEREFGKLLGHVAMTKQGIEHSNSIDISFKLEGLDFRKLETDRKLEERIAQSIQSEIASLASTGENNVAVRFGTSGMVQVLVSTADPKVAEMMHTKLVAVTASTGSKPSQLQAHVSRAVRKTLGSITASTGPFRISGIEVGPIIATETPLPLPEKGNELALGVESRFYYQQVLQLHEELEAVEADTERSIQAARFTNSEAKKVGIAPLCEVIAGAKDKSLGLALDSSNPGQPIVKEIAPYGWAYHNKIRPGTVILAVNGDDPARMSSLKLNESLKTRPLRLLVRPPSPLFSSDGLMQQNGFASGKAVNSEVEELRSELLAARNEANEAPRNMAMQRGRPEELEKVRWEMEQLSAEASKLDVTARLEMATVDELKRREREAQHDAVMSTVAALHSDGDMSLQDIDRAQQRMQPSVLDQFRSADQVAAAEDFREEVNVAAGLQRQLHHEEVVAIEIAEEREVKLTRWRAANRESRLAWDEVRRDQHLEHALDEQLAEELKEEDMFALSERTLCDELRAEVVRAQQAAWREGALADFLHGALETAKAESLAAKIENRKRNAPSHDGHPADPQGQFPQAPQRPGRNAPSHDGRPADPQVLGADTGVASSAGRDAGDEAWPWEPMRIPPAQPPGTFSFNSPEAEAPDDSRPWRQKAASEAGKLREAAEQLNSRVTQWRSKHEKELATQFGERSYHRHLARAAAGLDSTPMKPSAENYELFRTRGTEPDVVDIDNPQLPASSSATHFRHLDPRRIHADEGPLPDVGTHLEPAPPNVDLGSVRDAALNVRHLLDHSTRLVERLHTGDVGGQRIPNLLARPPPLPPPELSD